MDDRADDSDVARAAVAVRAIFASHGFVWGTLAARMPWVADHAGVTLAELGVALAMPAAGALLGIPVAGRIIHRLGRRLALRILLGGWAAALLLPALARSLPMLVVALLVCGVFAGTADMAMNAEAVSVEKARGRSIMSSVHGMWSVGGLSAGALGTLLAARGVDAPLHFAAVALAAAVAAVVAPSALLPAPARAGDASDAREEDVARPRGFRRPRGRAFVLAVMGFSGIFTESATAEWAAVYLVRVVGATPAAAAAAYATFAGAMTLSRLSGDFVVRRLGRERTFGLAGALAFAGGVAVVLANGAPMAFAGFALVGIGIATVVPLVFSAAGGAAAPEDRANAIAAVASVAYTAGLVASPVVGALAALASLRVSFAVVTLLAVPIVVASRALRGPHPC